jgi:SAM-dependent methyltransferase
MSVHRSAHGFDSAADVYDRIRPGYTREAVEWLVDTLAADVILDLAAGSGKLTQELTPHARVIAVDPSEPMLARLRERAPEAQALVGTAEAIPLGDAAVDAVVVAQAFHWFDHDAALAEIHRVMRPGGRLALVWNRRDLEAPAHAVIEGILVRHKGDTPRHRDNDWRRAMDRSELFEPGGETEVENVQRVPRGGLADRVASTSFIAALPEDERAAVLEEVARREASLPEPLELPHVTELFVFRRRD